ncbi:MAG: glycosyl transferase family 1, partial [Calditrichaeota bacterium]
MNILFLSTEIPCPPDHGHHIRTLNVLRGLAARHDIHFIGFAKTSAELQHVEELHRLCKSVDIFMLSASRGLRLFWGLFLNLFSRLPFIVQRYDRPAAHKRIQQLLQTARIDLVHVDLLHVSLYRRDVNGIPTVLVEHNVESLRIKRRLKTERNILARLYLSLQYLK